MSDKSEEGGSRVDGARETNAAGHSSCARCGKPASLQCPQCLKLHKAITAVQGSSPVAVAEFSFCGQACFKQAWNLHKKRHSQGSFDGSDLRFQGYSFTGQHRPVRSLAAGGLRLVPDDIVRPDYAQDGVPHSEMSIRGLLRPGKIQLLSAEDQEHLRHVCEIGRLVLDEGARAVKPGVTTAEIDRVVHNATVENDCYPSPLNYRNFPKSCCTSVNEVICHGIPDEYELVEGDIVNIDVTCYSREGFHGDLNETYFVGDMPPAEDTRTRLVQTTYDSLWDAIDQVKPGMMYRDIGGTIEKRVRADGFQVVKSYCGHGIHKLFHTTPNIPHYAKNKAAGVARAGHAFTIEPMVNAGVWQDKTWPDDWTSVTRDGKLSAQFEHTLLVTEDGVDVLTARTDSSPLGYTVSRGSTKS